MKIKFAVEPATDYLLTIEWKSLYKYQAQLVCVDSEEVIEYVGSSPVQCILKSRYILDLKGLTISRVDSIVDYLYPVDEVLDAVAQLIENANAENTSLGYTG